MKRMNFALRKNYWVSYSICFLLVSVLVFSWFWASGHTFILSGGG